MEYSVHDESGVTVISLSGEIDVGHAARLRDLLDERIGDRTKPLLLDLSDVVFIDSSGLGVLIAAHRKAQDVEQTLTLANPQAPVQRVFDLTRTNRVFEVFTTVEDGVAALRAKD